ncbi:MAG: lipid A deacylase LpxR family protein [Acidobacteriota bacterium]
MEVFRMCETIALDSRALGTPRKSGEQNRQNGLAGLMQGMTQPAALRLLSILLLGLLLVFRAAAPAAAEDEPSEAPKDVRVSSTLTITEENDIMGGTDANYTNGTKIIWVSGDISRYAKDHWLPRFVVQSLRILPFLDDPGMQYNVGLSVGQTIFTPRHIYSPVYRPYDRPYAGWSFVGLALHAKTPYRLDTIEGSLGIVGPSSLAGGTQNTVHEILGLRRVRHWEHQINDEPALLLAWQRTLRVFRHDFDNHMAVDLLPHFGVTAGNVLTNANAGFEARLGYNLPWDFGTSLIRPGAGVEAPAASNDPRLNKDNSPGVHIFVGANGRAVARNMFLDGNTWQDSARVAKKPFVADVMAGVGVMMGSVKLTYTHVLRTQEFYNQKSPQMFGSVSLSWTF